MSSGARHRDRQRRAAREVAVGRLLHRIIARIESEWRDRLGPRRAQALRRALEELHEVVWAPTSG